jgi:hypothetical protein
VYKHSSWFGLIFIFVLVFQRAEVSNFDEGQLDLFTYEFVWIVSKKSLLGTL